jgi:hypothetical protein
LGLFSKMLAVPSNHIVMWWTTPKNCVTSEKGPNYPKGPLEHLTVSPTQSAYEGKGDDSWQPMDQIRLEKNIYGCI